MFVVAWGNAPNISEIGSHRDSEIQAEAIAQHIEYVIGMKKAIGDIRLCHM
jgi:hypothetical protein